MIKRLTLTFYLTQQALTCCEMNQVSYYYDKTLGYYLSSPADGISIA